MADRAKNYLWQLGEDITALLEQGVLTGKHPVFAETWEGLCAALAKRTLLYFDSFTTGSLPVPPAFLLSLTARQLPGYGISFEAVTEDSTSLSKIRFLRGRPDLQPEKSRCPASHAPGAKSIYRRGRTAPRAAGTGPHHPGRGRSLRRV
ncbi:MAG: hypothetical protein ACLUNZ_01420 [Evtepia sp.]